MDEFIRKNIIDRYISSSPTPETTIDIVKEISSDFSIKEVTVRQILIKEKVYVKKVKWRSYDIEKNEKDYIIYQFGNFGNIENRYKILKEISEKFYIKEDGIRFFAECENVWPLNDYEKQRKLELDAKISVEREERLKNDPVYQNALRQQQEADRNYRKITESIKKDSNSEFFSNIKTIAIFICVIIFLFAAFYNNDDRTSAEKDLDSYCTHIGRTGCSETARELKKTMDH